MPARTKYYEDIRRVGDRYRKFLLSVMGCPWNCSYCSSSSGHITRVFGKQAHRDYYMKHRPLEVVMDEAHVIAIGKTREIEWVDDDIFAGSEVWLLDLAKAWHKTFFCCIVDPYGADKFYRVPMYISTTSASVLRASDKLLQAFSPIVSAVGMGIQAIRPSSLRLFNRQWDNEDKMKRAYDRLVSFGYRVNLQFIVGLPVDDPVEDAVDTLLAVKRIGPRSICSCYPLQVYPGTFMADYCKAENIELNERCNGDTNSAMCHIKFPEQVQKWLRNICKLATFFVKYDMDEQLIRTLIDIDFGMEVSQRLSILRYKECVADRLGDEGENIFNEILGTMKVSF